MKLRVARKILKLRYIGRYTKKQLVEATRRVSVKIRLNGIPLSNGKRRFYFSDPNFTISAFTLRDGDEIWIKRRPEAESGASGRC